jgi:hypothetical protein
MFDYGVAMLFSVFMKDALELRVNGTLAAIRENDGVWKKTKRGQVRF